MNKIIDIRIGKDRHFEKINLNEMLKKIIGQFDDQIKEAKAKVIVACKIEEDIYNQRAYFESIFTNLLSNAIKYRNPKEPLIVRIDIQMVNGEVAIRFSDNGMGIELDQFRTKIFTPYQRFHLDVEGKGIGLYMIKSQIESMQGSINIESQPKQGTIFIINIPLVGT